MRALGNWYRKKLDEAPLIVIPLTLLSYLGLMWGLGNISVQFGEAATVAALVPAGLYLMYTWATILFWVKDSFFDS